MFLIFLLVEWGSHSLAFSHSSFDGGAAIHSSDTDHDDPCKTLIRCTDGKQLDPPNLRYDNQHNTFLDGLSELRFVSRVLKPLLVKRERVTSLFRPISPPFHPPEFS